MPHRALMTYVVLLKPTLNNSMNRVKLLGFRVPMPAAPNRRNPGRASFRSARARSSGPRRAVLRNGWSASMATLLGPVSCFPLVWLLERGTL